MIGRRAEASDQVKLIQEALNSNYALPWHNFTGIGEATGAFLLCKLLQQPKPNLMLQRSTVLSWDEIQNNNVVFLGSPKFNLHLKDIPTKADFVIEGGVIRNLQPRPGEQAEYRDVWKTKAELLEDYAIIHRMPGLHSRGEIMVLASSSTEAILGTGYSTPKFPHAYHGVRPVIRDCVACPQNHPIASELPAAMFCER